jgi:tRNA threonylcarbamoyladenosine biosynthesis protein TsaB
MLPDGRILSRHTEQPRQHTRQLFSFMDELLDEASLPKNALKGIACGQGPGAFTGVRIAIAVSQGLVLALNVPLIAVNSLQAMAASALHQHQKTGKSLGEGARIAVAADARMGEAYAQVFKVVSGIPVAENSPQLIALDQVPAWANQHHGDLLCGSAFGSGHQHAENKAIPVITEMNNQAAALAWLAHQPEKSGATVLEDPTKLIPVYLRNRVTHQR